MKIETENHQRKTKQFKLFKNIYKIHKTLLSLTEKERVDQLLISKKKGYSSLWSRGYYKNNKILWTTFHNLITQMKQNNFLKDTNYPNLHKEKQVI